MKTSTWPILEDWSMGSNCAMSFWKIQATRGENVVPVTKDKMRKMQQARVHRELDTSWKQMLKEENFTSLFRV